MKERAPYCCEPIKHLVGTDGVPFCKRVTAICWESAITYRPPWPAVCMALATVTRAKSNMVAVGESLTLPPARPVPHIRANRDPRAQCRHTEEESKCGNIVCYDLTQEHLEFCPRPILTGRHPTFARPFIPVADSLKSETKSVNTIPSSDSSFTPSWPVLTTSPNCRLRPR